jgi:DNA-binding beta-propeller fold protein YncE
MTMTTRVIAPLILFTLLFTTTEAQRKSGLTFTKIWTHGHTTTGQVSEIPAYDQRTHTVWVAGVVGVDVLHADNGSLVAHIDVTPVGFVNSVAIHGGLAALAIEAPDDRRNAGRVLFYDTATRLPASGVNSVQVGSLPDMLTFTPDGSKLLVVNEGTPNAAADEPYEVPDPPGSVSVIDMPTRTVIATAGFSGVPQSGSHIRNPGMDFEPEYIAVQHDGTRAFVTVQEGNAIAELDLLTNSFTKVIGLGAKDFNLPGNEIDSWNNGTVSFQSVAVKGLYMPDSVAAYDWRGTTYLVLANEGDLREDNGDRATAGSAPYSAVDPLRNLRISSVDSSPGNLFAAGARSFSIRDASGDIVYDSGSLLDREARDRGLYDDGRSRDKGVEPEGVALAEVAGRTFAFIGLERTTTAAVAVFDVTSPFDVRFLDFIVTPGDRAPEGLVVFRHRGVSYLAIANETPAAPGVPTNTTLYRLDWVRPGQLDR